MAAVVATPLVKSSKPQVLLVPWDPASPAHVQRLVQQRIACGWDHEAVEGWKAGQESGKSNLQWIVSTLLRFCLRSSEDFDHLPQLLDDSDPEKDAKLRKHAEAYPQEQEPLLDSAISFGGQSRTIPSPRRTFTPVGHISLGRGPTDYKTSGFAQNAEGLYWISNFYVSRALQGSGLGSAAMDTVENLAISEPLCAKTLAMNAINKDDPDREEKYKALGLTIPPASGS
ncbi:MAG: hypothetical protein M1818_004777 [Claussenomyces sp. TS43310]|nr:MAG: hypothetical protein M1818_004777 [Claussenomyces sp. TS43310]